MTKISCLLLVLGSASASLRHTVKLQKKESSIEAVKNDNGNDNQWDCFFATTFSSCHEAVDASGASCHWCGQAENGICLSSAQSKWVNLFLPDANCQDASNDSAPGVVKTTASSLPWKDIYDPLCLSATDCSTAVGLDGNACTWCDAAGVFGLCLSSEQAKAAGSYLTCDPSATAASVATSEASSSSSSSVHMVDPSDLEECMALSDEQGCDADAKCTFCTAFGYAVCVTPDIAAMADGVLVQCDSRVQQQQQQLLLPDPTCLIAVTDTTDPVEAETACLGTMDHQGQGCYWCTFGDAYGMCLTSQQSDKAGSYLQCDNHGPDQHNVKHVVGQPDPNDLQECLLLTDAQGCDADSKCTFCTAFGFGVCVTGDIAEMADGLAPLVQCDDSSASLKAKQQQIDPNELQECLLLMDEQGCNADSSCSWCSAAGYSVCVTSDIADMAAGFAPLVQCGASNEQPDPNDLQECLLLTDAQGCDADSKCTFCTAFGFGVCVTGDIAEMADGLAPLVQCDSNMVSSSSTDISCVANGLTAPDKENCEKNVDKDGFACVWCMAPTDDNAGFCFNQNQANFASQILTCEGTIVMSKVTAIK